MVGEPLTTNIHWETDVGMKPKKPTSLQINIHNYDLLESEGHQLLARLPTIGFKN